MLPHYDIRVQGRVQGVFFRASTQKEALRLGLKGFVKNVYDGTVYIEVEGEQQKIDQLLKWIGQGGPPRAEVFNYDCNAGDFKDYKSFEIR